MTAGQSVISCGPARLQGRPRRRRLEASTRRGAATTCAQRETLTIGGFALEYAGKVDHGFDKVSVANLRKRLEPLVRKTQAFAKRVAHRPGQSS
jgi:ATP-dependent DNA ligase